MRRYLFLLVAAALTGCGSEPPSAAECERLTDVDAIIDRCLGGDLERGTYVGDTACLPYGPSERMNGVWLVALEHSTFHAGAATFSPDMFNAARTWLETDEGPAEAMKSMQGFPPRAYRVELVGRRSLCRGHYGHLGMFSHHVLVDRFVSIRSLPPIERAVTAAPGAATPPLPAAQ